MFRSRGGGGVEQQFEADRPTGRTDQKNEQRGQPTDGTDGRTDDTSSQNKQRNRPTDGTDLRGDDDGLARLVALLDHHLLRREDVLVRDLHPQVAAGHHDAVGGLGVGVGWGDWCGWWWWWETGAHIHTRTHSDTHTHAHTDECDGTFAANQPTNQPTNRYTHSNPHSQQQQRRNVSK